MTEAVVRAEQKTAAEICPVIAGVSGRYDRAEDIIGLWLSFFALITLWYAWPPVPRDPHAWGELSPGLQLAGYLLVMLAAFVVGALLGSRIGWLRRWFTPAQQMQDEVLQRAQSVFFDKRVHHTEAAGGVLIYVSLAEHQAVILGDRTILETVGQETITAWHRELTAALRQSGVIDALCQTIDTMGLKLAEALPRQADDVNELADALIVLD